MTLSLEKKVDLVKQIATARAIPDTKVAVKTCIDISLSIKPLFDNGTVQEVVDRMLAVAVRFDDNQSIECYAFGSGAARLDDVTPAMFGNYVNTRFLPQAKKSGHLWSGTDYSSAFKLVAKDSKGGFFKKAGPSYLMFVTDGETFDERAAEDQIKALDKHNVYVQLIGVGNADFRFLYLMADRYDHVGFVYLPNLASMSDEHLYERLLTDELAGWLRKF